MDMELNPTGEEKRNVQVKVQGGSSEAVYGLGMIGAWVFYFQRATTLQERVQAFFKGLVWPAFLVYKALKKLEK